MEDRRKLKRRHLIYYLRVFDCSTGGLIGHLVDITPEGMMLMGEDQLPAGQVYCLKMNLPEEMIQKQNLEFEALSLWSSKDINPDFYDTGFQLQGVDPEKVAMIERLIHEFGFRD